jgi:hypothetical protein
MKSYGYVYDPEAKEKTKVVDSSTLRIKNTILLDDIESEKQKQGNTRNREILDTCTKIVAYLNDGNITQADSLKNQISNSRSCCERYCLSFFKSTFDKLIDRTLAAQPIEKNGYNSFNITIKDRYWYPNFKGT